MPDQLFKVNISTDIMVYAKDTKEAVILAQQKAVDEVGAAEYNPIAVKYLDEIPVSWQKYIPYCPNGMKQIDQKCEELVSVRSLVELPKNDVKPQPVSEPISQAIKPVEAHPEKPMPSLKFHIPVAGRKQ